MQINPGNINFVQPQRIAGPTAPGEDPQGKSFLSFLQDSLQEVNQLQNHKDDMTVSFAAGDPNVDIHNLMLAIEEASISMQLTTEIRNKLIEAYQEIMRMQL